MNLPEELLSKLEQSFNQLKTAADLGNTLDSDLWDYFEASEQQLIGLMNGNPPAPDAAGSMEVSWMLYYLNNQIPDDLKWILPYLQKMGLRKSSINSSDWEKWVVALTGAGVLTGDGSLVNFSRYAILDPRWFLALIDYFLVKLHIIGKAPFKNNPAIINSPYKTSVRIAMLGDCGTGPYTDGHLSASPSQLVLQQISKLNPAPDAIIHLGDVYYSGSSDEEKEKLVNCWPGNAKISFTLNSNHEMYHGAKGLFETAFDPYGPFAGQNQTSYFQVNFGDWIIIGLDSAYNDPSALFMDGAITDSGQLALLNAAGKQQGKKVMLLSHHNPIDITGKTFIQSKKSGTTLWKQVTDALGRTPDYWYWGHVHNGVVYNNQSVAGSCNCRCLGHAAIPFGKASWLDPNPGTITYFANTPLPNPTREQELRVMNGYAVLDFTTNGVTETWYNQDGSVAWQS